MWCDVCDARIRGVLRRLKLIHWRNTLQHCRTHSETSHRYSARTHTHSLTHTHTHTHTHSHTHTHTHTHTLYCHCFTYVCINVCVCRWCCLTVTVWMETLKSLCCRCCTLRHHQPSSLTAVCLHCSPLWPADRSSYRYTHTHTPTQTHTDTDTHT